MMPGLKTFLMSLTVVGLIAGCAESSFNGGEKKKKPSSGIKDSDAGGDQENADGAGGGEGSGDTLNGGAGSGVLEDGSAVPAGDGGAGSATENPQVPGQFTQKFTQLNAFAVDIVMVFDTSGSMYDEQKFIEANMAKFVADLNNAALDAKVTVIGKKTAATDPKLIGNTFTFPTGIPEDKFAQVDQYVHSTDAIGHLNRYLAGELPHPIPWRNGVPLEVVSDDNGHNTDNNPYKTPRSTAAEFSAPAGRKVVVDAVVGLQKGASANPKCTIENVGTEHITLANKTGGTVFDLCSPDWNNLLKAITDKIVARNSGFSLDKVPDLNQKFEVFLNGKLVSSANYTVDAANRVLKFKDTFIVPNGAEIVVRYHEQK